MNILRKTEIQKNKKFARQKTTEKHVISASQTGQDHKKSSLQLDKREITEKISYSKKDKLFS
ncbi:MAG: hypothetical protein JWQ27_247 [Ferruginibacter sp.]|nr:hypothetical protein [Ferruginibacter sp.]